MMAISSDLDEADHARLVVLVGELAAGGREQQERQDEERADRPGPASVGGSQLDLQLVGDQHGERELEQVVVAGAEELGPEERREAALAEQRELVRVGVRGVLRAGGRRHRRGCSSEAPEVRRAARDRRIYLTTWTGPPRPSRSQPAKHRVDRDGLDAVAEALLVRVVVEGDVGAGHAGAEALAAPTGAASSARSRAGAATPGRARACSRPGPAAEPASRAPTGSTAGSAPTTGRRPCCRPACASCARRGVVGQRGAAGALAPRAPARRTPPRSGQRSSRKNSARPWR